MKKLIDSFGRVHDYLRLSLTDKCNLRCNYCMPAEGLKFKPRAELMQKDEIVSIVNTFVDWGINKVRLTGGEPLVRSDFASILNSLSEMPVELAITTNGILLNEYFDELKNAGIKTLNISLDTLQEHKFTMITRRKAFRTVMQNIQDGLKMGFTVKLNAVLIKNWNENEILAFIELTRNSLIDVRFIEYMPFNGNSWEYEKVVSYADVMRTVRKEYEIHELENHQNSTSKNYKIKNGKGTFGVISTITEPFCEGCNRLRLTADGKLKNCLFATAETDLLTAFRKGKKIDDLIQESVIHKHFTRGGLDDFEMKGAGKEYERNRSMINIGG